LGVDTLDGDQVHDGYSLDYASDLYCEGKSPSQAARIFKREMKMLDIDTYSGSVTQHENSGDWG
jgi:hypothetical protein